MRGWRAALAGLALAPSPAAACDLALALALDVSSSVDAREFGLQFKGLAAALISPDVKAAILSHRAVWLMAFEWSGEGQQTIHLPWTRLTQGAEVDLAAARIAGAARGFENGPTALGDALSFAYAALDQAPAACLRQVIDVAADGLSNAGPTPRRAYIGAPADVTVNALAIEAKPAQITAYFRGSVIRGPGAFVETARGYEDFERAMTRKLLREIGFASLAELDAPLSGD